MKNLYLLIFLMATCQMASAQCEDGEIGVNVQLFTDNWGYEISFSIQDEDGNTLVGETDFESNTEYNFDYCFPEGCYTIIFDDTFGDGIVGEGYIVTNEYFQELAANGGNFGNQDVQEFCLEEIEVSDFDLAITGLNEINDLCATSFAPIIDLRNEGEETINEAVFEYFINGESVGTYEWTGELTTYQTTTLTLPVISDLVFGETELEIELISINGVSTDDMAENNTIASTFNVSDDLDVLTLMIDTGNDPEVSGFEIIVSDFEGNEIFFDEDFEPNASYEFTICANPSCYTLEMIQNIGNNLFNTPYSLVDNEGNVLFEGPEIIGYFGESFCTPNADILDYDVSLIEIIEPNEEPVCGDVFFPAIEFANLGGETVTALTIEYQIDEEEPQVFEWTGSVNQFQSETISLPSIQTPGAGTHDFTVNIIAVNGEEDEQLDNNQEVNSFDVSLAQAIVFSLTTEGTGFSISYEFTDEDGNVIDADDDFPDNTTITNVYCIEPGCYTLTVEDFFGDGGAEFVVENELGIVLAESEPFDDDITVEVCAFPLDLEDLDGQVSNILNLNSTLCDPTVSPTIEFFNNGFDPITEIVFEYAFDGGLVLEETWTGNISTYQTSIFTLPALSNLPIGVHDLTVNIVEVNGQTDSGTDNNNFTQNFTIIDAASYAFNFMADIAPQENSYQILDESGTVLFSAEMGTFTQPFALNIEDFCLYPGCYTLVLTDETGDGGPSFSITSATDEIIIEGVYESGIGNILEVPFCASQTTGGLPLAAIEISPTTGCTPLNVEFTDVSSNADSWLWSFTGANIESSTEQNPSVTYNSAGNYAVSLTVTNEEGESSIEQSVTIYENPSIEFNLTDDVVSVISTGIESYLWSDGTTDSSTTFTDNISVTVTDANGCSTTSNYVETSINTLPAFTKIAIYPNPSNGNFTLKHNLTNDYQISVQDVMGRIIAQPIFAEESILINLDKEVPNGLYFLQIENGNHLGVYKIVVE